MRKGGCHCGQVRYELKGEVMHHALCHCEDCRRHAGAPMVGWAMYQAGQLEVTGETVTYHSSEHGRREFCPRCGTSLFYRNESILPGIVDVQSSTMDDPASLPPGAQIQVADRIAWMTTIGDLPEFERFPGP